MAGLTGFGLEAAFLARLDDLVRIFLEGVEDVFVTSLAGGGSDVFGGFVIRLSLSFGGGGRFLLRAPGRGEGERGGRRQHRQ
jgi:hypothetical protein